MSVLPGTKLGPYEILSPIGAGGMGEVWKARDTRLGRTVAIKVLPEALAKHPDLRARLEREARAVAALSHPHICPLYDVGSQDGTDYFVMEYLEGETLADRLARGALPLPQVLRTGAEIAEALDKAHRAGVVHRDLKPGNVILTKSGARLLDFGLARVREDSAEGELSAAATARPLTEKGTILGTFRYMSPEQLEGKEADPRSDIFALGALLYEMATGRRAFEGSSQASLISAIMKDEPAPISAVQPMAPAALDRVVRTCLAKEPDDRWQSAHDVAAQLRAVAESSEAGVPAPAVRARRRGRERLAWTAAALGFVAALLASFLPARRGDIEGPVRLALSIPPHSPFGRFDSLAPSPDGRRIAFVAYGSNEKRTVAVRALESAAVQLLAGTEGARLPFWSPDGRSIGFFADGKLKRIDLAGGPPRVVADAKETFGASWGKEDVIVFGTGEETLSRVAASGGPVTPATKLSPGEEAHRWPAFLPDGRRFVFLGDAPTTVNHTIRLGSLDSLESRSLVPAVSSVAFAPPDVLLYVRTHTLLAQRVDPRAARTIGEPVAVGEQVAAIGPNHLFDFGASAGLLAYQSRVAERTLAWFDRSGTRLGALGESGLYADIRLSPDGRRLAFMRPDQDGRPGSLWVMDVARGTVSRLTSEPGGDFAPLWSAAGDRILFTSMRRGKQGDVYETPSGGGGPDTLVLESPGQVIPTGWGPDGRSVVVDILMPGARFGIGFLSLADKSLRDAVKNAFANGQSALSADGRLLAYVSDESGRAEVYVKSLADGVRFQVSTAGGVSPRWRRDGRELFFASRDTILSSAIGSSGALEAGEPKKILEAGDVREYDVTADGQRILVSVPAEVSSDARATVVLGWRRGLPR